MKNIIILLFVTFSLMSCNDYTIKDNKVYFTSWNEGSGKNKKLIEGADFSTFEELKYGFGKDKSNVFIGGNMIVGADPQTFEIINEIFSKDKNYAYYSGEIIKNAVGKNFKPIDEYFSTDGKDVFLKTEALHVCSVKNFKFVFNDEESYTNRWITDGCNYYFGTEKIPSNDYKSIKIYRHLLGLAKDKNWVYLGNRKLNFDLKGDKLIDTIDAQSFEVVDKKTLTPLKYLAKNEKGENIDFTLKDKFGCIDNNGNGLDGFKRVNCTTK
ncbi:DKNYY domain-containing protein [Sphingobacterium sp. SRCM116780]|uniref:DKNYY domain-containing protein n=1 Tax=Sphingobacterium sp. SRCM116780 TaxID=2907623 RepID=UPI001F26C226|nr:DKNYY domain-containing protein [Sphingobacterium sp. SRCM116780]UIR56773.1 DKNYY domain-containing protein [Sphingobacterium sp. SRCM116780]